ncbi:hypothetical protein Q1695_003775 [Nippostrongylus brasiliensis]|nr:hypothetical protein Q1695_003775 [Nippostrongylus brasiliensis]
MPWSSTEGGTDSEHDGNRLFGHVAVDGLGDTVYFTLILGEVNGAIDVEEHIFVYSPTTGVTSEKHALGCGDLIPVIRPEATEYLISDVSPRAASPKSLPLPCGAVDGGGTYDVDRGCCEMTCETKHLLLAVAKRIQR